MKRIIFILILFSIQIYHSQKKCDLEFASKNSANNGIIRLVIKNISKEKKLVPKSFNSYYARIYDIQFYDEESNYFKALSYKSSDFNCNSNCFGKLKKIKNGKIVDYDIDIKEHFPFSNKGQYRFKISFNTYLFSSCSDYNPDYWFYYNID